MKRIEEILRNLIKNKRVFIPVLIAFIVIIIAILIIVVINNKTDGMKNVDDVSIYYRTYTDENGWSRWSKNGFTSGNKKDNIKNIEVKFKGKKIDPSLSYNVYTTKWSVDYIPGDKMKNKKITGIAFDDYDILRKRFYICYRTYNEKNKWLNWSCNSDSNGNTKYNVKAIAVKFVPRKAVLSDYLKNYSINKKTNYNF